ncbi:MAG TPA: porin [Myxococcota bacterium]
MRWLLPILSFLLLLGPAWAPAARAEDDAEKAELRDRLRAVEDELRLLRRQFEVGGEEAARDKERSALVTADRSGFQIRSRDGKSYRLRLRGYVQTDGRFFPDGGDDTLQETFTLRRVRPIFEGTLFEYADFRIMPDFGGGSASLQDAYLNLRPWKAIQLQTGKFKAPFGLERLRSGTALTFIERGLPTELAPNRDIGAMLHGEWREGLLTWQAMVGNGVQDASSADADTNDDKELVLRVFGHPFQETAFAPLQGLGIGFAASIGEQEGSPARYRTSGRNTFFRYGSTVVEDGTRVRWSPQAYWYWGPFGALFEYVRSSPQLSLPGGAEIEPDIDAWQIALSYVLTGEAASFRGVTPLKPFRGKEGGYGAFELAARYHELRIDDDVFDEGFASRTQSAERARAWTFGVNWYLNPFVTISLNLDQTFFEGGGEGGGDRPTETAVLSRFQVAF